METQKPPSINTSSLHTYDGVLVKSEQTSHAGSSLPPGSYMLRGINKTNQQNDETKDDTKSETNEMKVSNSHASVAQSNGQQRRSPNSCLISKRQIKRRSDTLGSHWKRYNKGNKGNKMHYKRKKTKNNNKNNKNIGKKQTDLDRNQKLEYYKNVLMPKNIECLQQIRSMTDIIDQVVSNTFQSGKVSESHADTLEDINNSNHSLSETAIDLTNQFERLMTEAAQIERAHGLDSNNNRGVSSININTRMDEFIANCEELQNNLNSKAFNTLESCMNNANLINSIQNEVNLTQDNIEWHNMVQNINNLQGQISGLNPHGSNIVSMMQETIGILDQLSQNWRNMIQLINNNNDGNTSELAVADGGSEETVTQARNTTEEERIEQRKSTVVKYAFGVATGVVISFVTHLVGH